MRVILPLGALAIAAAVVIAVQKAPNLPGISIGEIEFLQGTIAISNPEITGFASGGRSYTITTSKVKQDINNQDTFYLITPKGRITTKNQQEWFDFSATDATYNRKASTIVFNNRFNFSTKSGVSGVLTKATANLDAGTLRSQAPVDIKTKFYTIKAGGVSIDGGGGTVVFSNRVTMKIPEKSQPQTDLP